MIRKLLKIEINIMMSVVLMFKTSPINNFEQGNQIYCPYCEMEGKKHKYVCWIHCYVYKKWWMGMKKTFENSK